MKVWHGNTVILVLQVILSVHIKPYSPLKETPNKAVQRLKGLINSKYFPVSATLNETNISIMSNLKQCTMNAGEVLGAMGIFKLEKSLWGFFLFLITVHCINQAWKTTNPKLFVSKLSWQHKTHSGPNRRRCISSSWLCGHLIGEWHIEEFQSLKKKKKKRAAASESRWSLAG